MPTDLSRRFVVGVSSRALFDLRAEDSIFEREGVAAYSRYQVEHEDVTLDPGPAFSLVRGILRLNETIAGSRKVEVIIMSRNNADTSLRIFRSCEHHGLDITRAALTSGRPLAKYLGAFSIDLFLSAYEDDVQSAINVGFAAGLVLQTDAHYSTEPPDEIKIAFDGDAVLFSPEAEWIYKRKGLDAFLRHERDNARKPLPDGPFAKLLRTLAVLQRSEPRPSIRTALVTARNSPAHERVIRTLREWGVRVDEAFFMGGVAKDKILAAFGAHIFFDDQEDHLAPASRVVPAARVPYREQDVPENDPDAAIAD